GVHPHRRRLVAADLRLVGHRAPPELPGDLAMALAWCLPTGLEHPLPYFYFAYMIVLLVHRERRDHDVCRAKYGADWDAYCRKVRLRNVAGVYWSCRRARVRHRMRRRRSG